MEVVIFLSWVLVLVTVLLLIGIAVIATNAYRRERGKICWFCVSRATREAGR